MKLHDITYDTPGDKSIWTWRALSQPITWEDFQIYRTASNRPQLDSPFQALSLLTKLEATDAQWLKALEYFTALLANASDVLIPHGRTQHQRGLWAHRA